MPNGGAVLGIIPPEPLGESPPFPISRLTKSRPLLCGMENWAGGFVDVAPAITDQKVTAIGENLKPPTWNFIIVGGWPTKVVLRAQHPNWSKCDPSLSQLKIIVY